MKTFWFVTSIDYNFKDFPSDTRCWGFFDTFFEAEQSILGNDSDIHESKYNFVVVEEHKLGMVAGTGNIQWYKWDDKENKYGKIEAPEKLKNTVSWGIG